MDIILNGKKEEITDGMTIGDLIKANGYGERVGVWVNEKQLLKKEYGQVVIKPNDKVKIIRIVGGG